MQAQLADRSRLAADGRPAWKMWLLCLALWLGSFLATTVAFQLDVLPPAMAMVLAIANGVLGVLAVTSYFRLLRRADELERKIQVEALALGFGAGAVGMMAYRLAERAGAPAMDINDALLVMLLAYVVGVVVARRHYS
jgi:hypothetical protein